MKKNYRIIWILIPLFWIFNDLWSQEHLEEHEHHHANFEIGTGGGMAYVSENGSFSPAFHLHFTKIFSETFGAGIGYELIAGDELHQTIGVSVSYTPFHWLSLQTGPGLALPSEDAGVHLDYHAELAFIVIHGEHFHFGPLIDSGFSGHGYHVVGGVHFGIEF